MPGDALCPRLCRHRGFAGTGSIQPAAVIAVPVRCAPDQQGTAPKQHEAKAKAPLKQAGYANGFTATQECLSDIPINGQNARIHADSADRYSAIYGRRILSAQARRSPWYEG
jgi:hypothetical protein